MNLSKVSPLQTVAQQRVSLSVYQPEQRLTGNRDSAGAHCSAPSILAITTGSPPIGGRESGPIRRSHKTIGCVSVLAHHGAMGTHEATNAANAKAARAAGWPELTGFDRQIPWAITVRADKMREFDAAVAEESMSDADRVLNPPGESGDFVPWEGWSHVRIAEEVPAGAA